MTDRWTNHRPSNLRLPLPPRITVAGLALAAVFCVGQAGAQTADGFNLTPPKGMTAEPVTNRQFDTGFGVKASDGSIPTAGSSSHPCLVGFKFNSANNGLSRAEINKTTGSKEWRTMVRGFIGMIFDIRGERAVSVQGYNGVELAVVPKGETGAGTVRGLMTMVETPKGRMTSVCMTTAPAYAKAEPRFRAVPRGLRLPE